MLNSSSNTPQRALVSIALLDGKKAVVSVKLSVSGKLSDTLNNADRFLDVISGAGEAYFIPKSAIARIESANPPQAKLNLQRRAADKASFNPWAVLGIEKTATPEMVRAAYVNLVRVYHPDRFSEFDLPQEMKDYATAMLARINLAYEQVS